MESTLLCAQMVGRGKEEEEEDREGTGRKRGGRRTLPNYVQCAALFPDLLHFVFRFAFSIRFRVQWTLAYPATTGPDHGWINEIAGYVESSCK